MNTFDVACLILRKVREQSTRVNLALVSKNYYKAVKATEEYFVKNSGIAAFSIKSVNVVHVENKKIKNVIIKTEEGVYKLENNDETNIYSIGFSSAVRRTKINGYLFYYCLSNNNENKYFWDMEENDIETNCFWNPIRSEWMSASQVIELPYDEIPAISSFIYRVVQFSIDFTNVEATPTRIESHAPHISINIAITLLPEKNN